MKLTEEQRAKLIKKLEEVWPPPRTCSSCSKQNWSITDRIMELREFNQGSMVLGGDQTLIPTVVASCNSCGNTVVFNAILLGLIDPKNGSINV